ALHRRRLAGAVRSDEAEDLAIVDLERDVVDRQGFAVGLADSGDSDDRTGGMAHSVSYKQALAGPGKRISRQSLAAPLQLGQPGRHEGDVVLGVDGQPVSVKSKRKRRIVWRLGRDDLESEDAVRRPGA